MSIKHKYNVKSIDKALVKEWCLKKHYAKKMPSVVQYTFGCFDKNNIMIGVAVFGLSGNSNLNDLNGIPIIELTRLILNDEKEKNTTSYFVGQCLKMISHKGFVISFADANQKHNGYIYQATNWIYTGQSAAAEVYTNGNVEMHSKTFSDKYGRRDKAFAESIGFYIEKKQPKHRYFFILGNKTEKKKYLSELIKQYEIKPYPKGENQNYDASYKPTVQTQLF
jgi:hypothetical protein